MALRSAKEMRCTDALTLFLGAVVQIASCVAGDLTATDRADSSTHWKIEYTASSRLLAEGKNEATLPCVATSGSRSYDFAELNGVFHSSAEEDSMGWKYTFSLCENVPPNLINALCSRVKVQPSAIFQETVGVCYSLGVSTNRTFQATPRGVEVFFSGGDRCGNADFFRSTVIKIKCADVEQPRVVRWNHGKSPCTYKAQVIARSGCAIECGRNSNGSFCGGADNGACIDGRCSCVKGYHGNSCSDLEYSDLPKHVNNVF